MNKRYVGDEESDIGFLLSFVPDWALIVPEGLDPTFYGTLSREGDLAVKERVDKIRTKAYGDKCQCNNKMPVPSKYYCANCGKIDP